MDTDAPIRVALVRLAPLVRDVVHNLIAGERGMRVTGVVERNESADALGRDSADVYLVGVSSDDAASACEPLLGEPTSPRRVIGISLDGRQLHVSELRPTTSALGSLSSDELLDVIRRTPH